MPAVSMAPAPPRSPGFPDRKPGGKNDRENDDSTNDDFLAAAFAVLLAQASHHRGGNAANQDGVLSMITRSISRRNLSRRTFLGGAAASPFVLSGLGAPAQAAGLTIGIIYVGPRADYGWNQAHAVGAKALKDLPGVKVVEEENVPETVAVTKTMESMINIDGATLLFPTSFGYFNPFMLDAAKKYPKIEFRHPTSLWKEGKDPTNAGGYFCYLDQGHYVNGIAAGLSTKSNKIGYIAAKPIPLVLRNVNSFTLGARKVNPNATVQLIVTGDWAMPVREAEAANALVDAGCDIIACHIDSPKVVVETAEKRGVKSCGHNANQADLAPKGFITGAELKWGTIYTSFAGMIGKGEKLPNMVIGGYDKDMVQSSAFGAGCSDAGRNAATAAIADLKAGKPIFTGTVKSNAGKVITSKDTPLYDPSLESTDYLVEGIVGSV
jgi:basic membrane protein A